MPKLEEGGLVTVDMGKPRLRPSEIPFLPAEGAAEDALRHDIAANGAAVSVGLVNMGNPHAVLTVDDTDAAPVATLGAALETHPQFPEKANIGFMQVFDPHRIRLRVFERGVGETQACGTGACAAVVHGVRLGLLAAGEPVEVSLPGGRLRISWREGGSVMMTGPAQTVFDGVISYQESGR